MKKSKQILLLLFYIYSTSAFSREKKVLRYCDLGKLSKLSASTIRGIVSRFVRTGTFGSVDEEGRLGFLLTKNGMETLLDTFPSLHVLLKPSHRPMLLVISRKNLTGAKKHMVEQHGGVQYRSGVWLFSDQHQITTRLISKCFSQPLTLRLDGEEMKEVWRCLQSTALYSSQLRMRKDLRNLLLKRKGGLAGIERLRKLLTMTPFIPENIFRNDLQLSALLQLF